MLFAADGRGWVHPQQGISPASVTSEGTEWILVGGRPCASLGRSASIFRFVAQKDGDDSGGERERWWVGEWRALPRLQESRVGPSLFALHGKVYVTGGCHEGPYRGADFIDGAEVIDLHARVGANDALSCWGRRREGDTLAAASRAGNVSGEADRPVGGMGFEDAQEEEEEEEEECWWDVGSRYSMSMEGPDLLGNVECPVHWRAVGRWFRMPRPIHAHTTFPLPRLLMS